MDNSDALMLSGITAACPDCGDKRVLLAVTDLEFCCTACDAAVFLSGIAPSYDALSERRAS